jgi:hypothetical protein
MASQSRFVVTSFDEIEQIKENAIPQNTKMATKFGVKEGLQSVLRMCDSFCFGRLLFSFPWFPVRLRNIRATLYLLIQGVGIHSFEEIFNNL